MPLRVASAPVSWGIAESVPFPPEYPYSRVLDEISEAGYSGTELGPFGFLPHAPGTLAQETKRRKLELCSAFVAFPLGQASTLPSGLAHVERTAELISQVGAHVLILSDEVTAERSAVAGRAHEANELSWTDAEWNSAERATTEVIRRCHSFGLKVAFHHHAGTHVETPQELDRLMSLFSSSDLGLCLDTGHCVYGGGDPSAVLKRYLERLRCVHLKDIHTARLEEARRRKLNFYDAVRSGVFTRLGEGTIDLDRVLETLRTAEFDGWVVVEQDVMSDGVGAAAPLANAIAGREFLRKRGY